MLLAGNSPQSARCPAIRPISFGRIWAANRKIRNSVRGSESESDRKAQWEDVPDIRGESIVENRDRREARNIERGANVGGEAIVGDLERNVFSGEVKRAAVRKFRLTRRFARVGTAFCRP